MPCQKGTIRISNIFFILKAGNFRLFREFLDRVVQNINSSRKEELFFYF